MMVEVHPSPYTVRGVSVAGIATSLHVPELRVLLDVGRPLRPFTAVDHIFLSHGHGDHAGGLPALIGMRELVHRKDPPRVYAPEEIIDDLERVLDSTRRLQRHGLAATWVPMGAGTEVQLRSDVWARAFATHHPVPSLGYQFFNRVEKLRPEFRALAPAEIGDRRRRGEALFDRLEHLELAYATDTLIDVVASNPSMLKSRVLILECSFLDDQKSVADGRAGGHIHLDELLEVAPAIESEWLVLMHFSLLYSPEEVRALLARRLPADLHARTLVFAPDAAPWPV